MNRLGADLELYWQKEAEKLSWFKPWERVLDWREPNARWFVGGELNASHVCLDVHIANGLGHKTAILWHDETGAERQLTYQDLYDLVNRFAAAMKKNGIKKGDVVAIYMPLLPEAIAAMLAVARLGAIHCVIFSGFGFEALRDRIVDVKAKFVITADVGIRRGKKIQLKEILDHALATKNDIERVIVVKNGGDQCFMSQERDVYFDDFIADAPSFCAPEPVESSQPLFILHTSGSTGKPKGVVHGTGGYLTYVHSTIKYAFNINQDSVYWCTAGVGWITGHSYVVYGPLMHGATIVLYEGAHDFPSADIWWQIIERYKVTIFYTAPTALRFFMKYGDGNIARYNLRSLEILGSVGEPINHQVWQWYFDVIGGKRCPIIDTWWQTEMGGFMIAPHAGMDPKMLKPGSVMHPMPGIDADIVSSEGVSVASGTKGFLVIKKPWPGMLMGIWGDPDRYEKSYWSHFKGMFDSGDCAIKDVDGCFWILGRADEVIKISGHRIGTAEIETATLSHPAIAETAAIGVDDCLRGQTIVVFAVLRDGVSVDSSFKSEIIHRVHEALGRFVVVSDVFCIDKLPKTRSGKILRRVLKAMVQGMPLGDLTTMEDECVIEEILAVYKNFKKS